MSIVARKSFCSSRASSLYKQRLRCHSNDYSMRSSSEKHPGENNDDDHHQHRSTVESRRRLPTTIKGKEEWSIRPREGFFSFSAGKTWIDWEIESRILFARCHCTGTTCGLISGSWLLGAVAQLRAKIYVPWITRTIGTVSMPLNPLIGGCWASSISRHIIALGTRGKRH